MSTADLPDEMPLDALSLYLHDVKWMAKSSPEEEARLIACVQEGKLERLKPCPNPGVLAQAKQARDRLVEVFQPLVIHIAKRYRRHFCSMDFADLLQEGNVGLLLAIDRNESGQESPLAAFISRYVRGAIVSALYRRDGMVRIDGRTLHVLRQLWSVEGRLVVALGREPRIEELAMEMGMGVLEVVELLEVRERKQVASVQGLLAQERNEDEYRFVSLFADAVAADTAHQEALEEVLRSAVETVLTPRQREVVQLRYGLEGDDQRGQSQQEVAVRLGIRREGVRNIEHSARGRLAARLRAVKQHGQVCYALRCTRHDVYYTAKEAMQRLGMASTTFYRQVYQGTIPGIRGEGKKDVWVFSQEVIDRFVRDSRREQVS